MSDGKLQSKAEDQEPSMEEILSSIRKIIASDEEEAKAEKTAAQGPARSVTEESDEVLELTEVVPADGGEKWPERAAAAEHDRPQPRGQAEAAEETRRSEAVERPNVPQRAMAMPGESLVSEEAASAATAAFAKLARSLGREQPSPMIPDSGKSIEVFLAELLRPLLKEWLDHNLPMIVERVVEQEVKKLAKRAELL